MPTIVSTIFRFVPWTIVILLAGANLWVVTSASTATDDGALWLGPPMPGKRLPLPDISTAKIIVPSKSSQSVATQKKKNTKQESNTAKIKPKTVKVKKTVVKVKKPPVQIKPPTTETKKETTGLENKQDVANIEAKKDLLVVQAGSFVLDMGVDSLMKRLKKYGFKPQLLIYRERVRLNNVQAGPYSDMESAKVVETKLIAAGMDVRVEETWEGFIISLSKSLLLGYAIQDMEKAETLDINPLRMVKIETDLPVKKVILGPFPTKDKAKEVSARVAQLGLAVPIIKPWIPPTTHPTKQLK